MFKLIAIAAVVLCAKADQHLSLTGAPGYLQSGGALLSHAPLSSYSGYYQAPGYHYAAAPAAVSSYNLGSHYAAAPVAGVASQAVYAGPAQVQNIFEERARVEPGQEFIYKVQAPPKVRKEVVQVAQVVQQPKVLHSEVVAPAKVDRETVVVEPKPEVVDVQPQLHKESLVFVQQQAKPQLFLAEKRRDTVAKRTEYEQHKFSTHHAPLQAPQIAYLGGAAQVQAAPVLLNNGYASAANYYLPGAAQLTATAPASVATYSAPSHLTTFSGPSHLTTVSAAAAPVAAAPVAAAPVVAAPAHVEFTSSTGSLAPSTQTFSSSSSSGSDGADLSARPRPGYFSSVTYSGPSSLTSSTSSLLAGTKA